MYFFFLLKLYETPFICINICNIVGICFSFKILLYSPLLGHEKILRGLAVGISLTMFNRLEESDALVTSLSNDKDPVLRRSGMYTIAMAYCGTGNNQAIRKLLHVAVSTAKRVYKCKYTIHIF